MNEVWDRLTPRARDRVDMALLDRGLLPAIVVLRAECGLDPAPGLYEAQEVVTQRQAWLVEQGLVAAAPQKELDVSDVVVAANAIACPVVAVEAVWDGDTQGWMIDLVAIVDRLGRYHERFDEVRLALIRRGSDLRLFNGQVPPWPEAVEAQQIGDAVAARLGVPFHFTSPETPDIDLPRWWDADPLLSASVGIGTSVRRTCSLSSVGSGTGTKEPISHPDASAASSRTRVADSARVFRSAQRPSATLR